MFTCPNHIFIEYLKVRSLAGVVIVLNIPHQIAQWSLCNKQDSEDIFFVVVCFNFKFTVIIFDD